jgi:hypothetical protein
MRPSLGACAITVAVAAGVVTSSATVHARDPVVCPPADGAPAKRARFLFEEAVQYEASEPERALALYQCAASLADRAVIELRIGVVAERLQRDDVAIAAFERYLAMAGSAAPDVDTMHQHVAELKASRASRAARARSAEVGPPPPPQPTTPPDAERSRTPVYLGWGSSMPARRATRYTGCRRGPHGPVIRHAARTTPRRARRRSGSCASPWLPHC